MTFPKRFALLALAVAVVSALAGCGRRHFCRDAAASYAPGGDCYNSCPQP